MEKGKRVATGGINPKMVEPGVIPESKIFVDPGAAELRALEPMDCIGKPLSECHVDGVLMRDLPEGVQQRILFQQTDEGIEWWEKNAHKLENRSVGASTSRRVRHTATDVDNEMREREDFLMDQPEGENAEPWMAPDARLSLVEEHVPAGMRAKFVDPKRLSKTGRDARGFEVVKDERGDAVTHGSSVLTMMPEKMARRRNEHYRRQSTDLVDQVYDRANEKRMTPEGIIESAPSR
jgi:hypothetical protein